MGTNYYIYEPKYPVCGKQDKIWHVGKSSGGWCFSLHVNPARGVNNLGDLKAEISVAGRIIQDEYGNSHTIDKMLAIITEREDIRQGYPNMLYGSDEQFHRENGSEPGPNGLIRSKVDGIHCVGHGKGTWDLIAGEFS